MRKQEVEDETGLPPPGRPGLDGDRSPAQGINGEAEQGELGVFQEVALDHPMREQMFETLSATPGLNQNQLARVIGVHRNNIGFHLSRMVKVGLVATRPSEQGNEVLCFRVGDVHLWEPKPTRILFGRSRKRDVGLYIAANPGTSTREVAEALGLSLGGVRHHFRTLERYKLINRFRAGQRTIYKPDPRLSVWAEEVGNGFEKAWDP